MSEVETFKKLEVVVLSSFGHNGLDWMHSLLDGHPNGILMPAWSYYRTLEEYKIRKGKSLLCLNINDISKEFVSFIYKNPTYEVVRRKFISTADEANYFIASLNEFLLSSKISMIEENLFRGVNYAFCKLHNIAISEKKIIFTQEHVPWHSDKYKKLLNPKFIFIMRDPRAGIAGSWKRQQDNAELKKMNSIDFDKINLYWTSAFEFFKKNKLTKKIKVMVNEDMHKDLRKEMNLLCQWLDIELTPSCFNETFLGVEWLGESSYLAVDELLERPPKDFYKIENVEKRWRSRLTQNDIAMIEVMLNNIFISFKYKLDTVSTPLKVLRAYTQYTFANLEDNYYRNTLLIPAIIIRNFIRRQFVIFAPTLSAKIFKII